MRVRPATLEDVSLILSFIQKKAEFDRDIGAYNGILQVTEEKIRKALFGAIPFSYVLFAEQENSEVGFALYGFRFSSFVGQPSLWLDDLYVDENQRNQGAGILLMRHLAQVALNHRCTHLAWTADARNIRGLSFYSRLGANIAEQFGYRCFLKWAPTEED
jgi:GNAT superfamily N-acetyltransferase